MRVFFLDQHVGSDPLTCFPTEFLHILVLLVVVEDEAGRYLLLEMLLYNDGGRAGDGPEGLWALPNDEFRVKWDGPPPQTFEAVQSTLAKLPMGRKKIERAAENRAWRLGLTDPKVEYLGKLDVLKPSPRLPDVWLAIRFHPVVAWSTAPSGRRNIADPEALRGVMHLPVDDIEKTVMTRRRDASPEWWYRGKPIAPEVQYLLAPERRAAVLKHPVTLAPDHFHRPEEGLIIVADLAGWGKALHVANKMTTIGIDGAESLRRLISWTTGELYRFLNQLGPAYAQEAGDGIMAVFPSRDFDIEEVLARLMPCWLAPLKGVEEINRYLSHHADVVLGSRLVIHHGSYRYGRMGQGRSHGPAVQGMSIVEAARIEQGLADLVRVNGGTDDGWRHTLAISEEMLKHHGTHVERLTEPLLTAEQLVAEGQHNLKAKESELPAHVWRICVWP